MSQLGAFHVLHDLIHWAVDWKCPASQSYVLKTAKAVIVLGQPQGYSSKLLCLLKQHPGIQNNLPILTPLEVFKICFTGQYAARSFKTQNLIVYRDLFFAGVLDIDKKESRKIFVSQCLISLISNTFIYLCARKYT